MKKLNNKGFTIVELVIVVAVIAILAAVLIPTVSGLIKTAQTGADVTLVKNVNLFLATERATEGKNATMQEALDDALEGGYDIEKLTPTNSDNHILWDQESDNFVLYANGKYNNAGAEVKVDENALYKLWNIADKTEGSKYSVYYTGKETTVNVNGVGFDAGESNVATVNYVSDGKEQDVIIRTNGGDLIINAIEDSIDHYGVANVVDVQAVKNASYHAFGRVTFIKVDTGRVVVESSAQIGGIHAVNNSAIIATEGGATLPAVSAESGVTPSGVDSVVTKTEAEAKEMAINAIPPEGVARIGFKGYETLQAAIDAAEANDVVTLLCDTVVNEGISISKKVTIDLNSHTILGLGDDVFVLTSELTIKGNGTVKHSGTYDIFYVKDGGSLTIENGDFSSSALIIYTEGSNDIENLKRTIVINGGSFYTSGEKFDQGMENEDVVYTPNPMFIIYNANVAINGGEFSYGGNPDFSGNNDEAWHTWAIYLANCKANVNGGKFDCEIYFLNGEAVIEDGEFYEAIGFEGEGNVLSIIGGTFSFDPSECVDATKYSVTANDAENPTSWIVAAK